MKPTESWMLAVEQFSRSAAALTSLGGHQAHSLEECVEVAAFTEDEAENKDTIIAELEARLADAEHDLKVAKGRLAQLMKDRESDV